MARMGGRLHRWDVDADRRLSFKEILSDRTLLEERSTFVHVDCLFQKMLNIQRRLAIAGPHEEELLLPITVHMAYEQRSQMDARLPVVPASQGNIVDYRGCCIEL